LDHPISFTIRSSVFIPISPFLIVYFHLLVVAFINLFSFQFQLHLVLVFLLGIVVIRVFLDTVVVQHTFDFVASVA